MITRVLCLLMGLTGWAETAVPALPEAVTTLADLVRRQPESRGRAVADRIAAYIWDERVGGGFISPAARQKPGMREDLERRVLAWVKDQFASGNASPAKLYYVLGAGGAAPDWLKGAEAWSGYRTQEWLQRMKPWTEKVPQGKKSPLKPGRLELKRWPEWPLAFLSEAADQAHRITLPAAAARIEDENIKRIEEELSGGREPAPGELRRFKNVRELVPPPVPKLTDVVPAPVEKMIEPILKPVDAVTQGVMKPIEALVAPATSQAPAKAP